MSSSLARLGRVSIARTSLKRSLPSTSRHVIMGEPTVLTLATSPTWQSIRGKKTKARDTEPSSSASSSSKGKKGRSSSSAEAEESAATVDWPPLFEDMEQKMTASFTHFSKELSVLENRASGRVNPSMLDSLVVPGVAGSERHSLKDIATVGVREGYTLVITVFDEKLLRQVVQALYARKDPGIIPQIINDTTIHVPISKPTLESRQNFVKEMSKLAENARVLVRGVREAALKTVRQVQKTPIDKSSTEAKKLQTITDKHIKQIDDLLKKTQSNVERL